MFTLKSGAGYFGKKGTGLAKLAISNRVASKLRFLENDALFLRKKKENSQKVKYSILILPVKTNS